MFESITIPKKSFYVAAFMLLFFQYVHGQQRVENIPNIFKRFLDTTRSRFDPSQPYYITKISPTQSKSLKIVRQLSDSIAIIEIADDNDFNSVSGQAIPTNNLWKYSPYAETARDKRNNNLQQFILTLKSTVVLRSLLPALSKDFTILYIDNLSHSLVVKCSQQILEEKLLERKEIVFIDRRTDPHPEISIVGYNRSFHGINAVDYSIPGANGKNIVTGIKEQKMDESDIDLYKRVIPSTISSANVTSHATVISTIIGGAGNSFYDGRGIAYGCNFFPSTFSNLFADDSATLNANKVTVQNHSYGTVIQQFYGAEAMSYDMLTWQNKNFIPVFSSGNSGTAAANDGIYRNFSGYANLTGNFKMAKNIITVGAIDNKGTIPAESSAGPLFDGRIAPQLVALGPDGTSDAAAVVTGTIAVMQQVYSDSNNHSLPAASLVKAILYNTAGDIYHTGIDYKTGYGSVNSFIAIKSIQQKEFDGNTLLQGQQWTKNISVPSNAAQLKVTLSWTDTAAMVNTNKALSNDLDLELVQITSGTIFKPWVLSSSASIDSLEKFPVRKRDSLNTAEQVSIPLPAAGTYQIKVKGTAIINPSILFNIAYHIDTLNTFQFISPQHTSDVNRQENSDLDIRWRTFVADTNQTGSLFISYDAGTNWQLIASTLKIYTNYYKWPINDTVSTAILRMQTSFGNFTSKEFVISKVIEPHVDFLCADSARLSWNKHIYAGSYRLYTLIDSPYLKPVLTLSDTFVVLNRNQYPSLVYAVEPMLTNGLLAARSRTIDITAQGVNCFYKTFYYDLPAANQLQLNLDLSGTGYIDTISFERVTVNGQLLKPVGDRKVAGNATVFHQLVNDPPAGTSYWRAKIKLKSGAIVYTNIISVLTSGEQYILFFPNPVDRNGTLNWLLQQNLPGDSKLRLYDIAGRLVRSYSEIPNTIDVRTLSPGVFIYKLLSNKNLVLETGKLIIR